MHVHVLVPVAYGTRYVYGSSTRLHRQFSRTKQGEPSLSQSSNINTAVLCHIGARNHTITATSCCLPAHEAEPRRAGAVADKEDAVVDVLAAEDDHTKGMIMVH